MYSDFELQSEIATNFMNNKVSLAIKHCYQVIKNQDDNVNDEFYQMLFDMLKVQNAKSLFEDASEQYRRITGRLPPDWENRDFNKMVSDYNTIEFMGGLNGNIAQSLDKFYKSCENNHFGRIDFNNLRLRDSDSVGMQMLLKSLYKLKKLTTAEILIMGDSSILDFNSTQFMIIPNPTQPEAIKEDEDVYGETLELLQAERNRKNKIILEKYENEFKTWQIKHNEIETKIKVIEDKAAGAKRGGAMAMTTSADRGGLKSNLSQKEQKELELLQEELAEHKKTEPKQPEIFSETFIEKRMREQQKGVENTKDESHESEEIKQLNEIKKKEELLYLLKLEVLQWNGQEQQYMTLSEEYRQKYKKFSPDYNPEYACFNKKYQQSRIASAFQITTAEKANINSVSVNNNTPVIESLSVEIHPHHLDSMIQYLDNVEYINAPIVYINLQKTNFFTYEAALKLMLFLQKQKNNGVKYDLFVKNCNSLIKVIFKMSGLSEYISY